jgi:cyclohexanecarboxylate-CoA ligase
MITRHPLLPSHLQDHYRAMGYWEDRTLAEAVRDWAERDPDRIAITGPRPFTYRELWIASRRLAGKLAEDVEPGEYVVAVMLNCWEGAVLGVAASIAGIALAPQSVRVPPNVVLTIAEQIGARRFILQEDLLSREEWARLRAARPRDVMTTGAPFEDAIRNATEIDQRAKDPGRGCLVLSTGGTTGMPKSVLLCENGMIWAAKGMAAACEFTEADVCCAFGPYGHASGSLFEIYMPFLFGARMLPLGRWQVRPVLEAIHRYGGTFCITVGTHMFDLLQLEPGCEHLLSSMRTILSGAGPDHLYEGVEARYGVRVQRCYGLSETNGHAVSRPHDPPELRLRFDGVPFPGIEYRIVDPDTREDVEPGQPGEYLCRGPSFFLGYVGQPELTAQRLTPDHFYTTGDVLIEHPGGLLRWEARLKEIVRRGGLMIDVIELSDLLSEHPAISEVIVVGAPDPRLGERAVAVVVPRGEPDPTLQGICGFLEERGIPGESLPEVLLFTDNIPRTEFGEFNRGKVRAWVIDQLAVNQGSPVARQA